MLKRLCSHSICCTLQGRKRSIQLSSMTFLLQQCTENGYAAVVSISNLEESQSLETHGYCNFNSLWQNDPHTSLPLQLWLDHVLHLNGELRTESVWSQVISCWGEQGIDAQRPLVDMAACSLVLNALSPFYLPVLKGKIIMHHVSE